MRRLVAAIAPLVLLAACASPQPVEAAASRTGVVHAPTAALAAQTAALMDQLVPTLLALDAGLVERPVDVVLRAGDGGTVYGGFDLIDRTIYLDTGRLHPEATLAHELVHAMEPVDWRPLPAVVREGLADHLAARAVPGVAAEMRRARARSLREWCADDEAPDPIAALAVPHGRIQLLASGRRLQALYGMGLLIVDRVGLAGLKALARETTAGRAERVAPDALLTAARLSADRGTWTGAIDALERAPRQPADLPPPEARTEPATTADGVRD